MLSSNSIKIKPTPLLFILTIGLLAYRLYQWRDLTTPLVDYSVDDLLYLKLSKAFYWGYAYDPLAFVRRPGFPLWIATVNTFGLSFAFAQKAAFLSLIAVFSVVANRIAIHKVLILGAVALSIYHPHAPAVLLRATPDGFYTLCIMAGISFGGMSFTSSGKRASISWAAMAGLALGMAFVTREEHILIIATLLVVSISCILIKWRLKKSYLATLTPLIATTAAIPLVISSINYYKFEQFSLSEFSSSNFMGVYKAALSVPQEADIKGVPLTQAGLNALYPHCPTWLELKPHIETFSKSWAKLTSSFTGNPNEVGAGAFPWLLKEVANAAGAYESPRTANNFYRKLHTEIRTAQANGKVGRRPHVISQLDPNWSKWFPWAISSFQKLATKSVYPGMVVVPYSANASPELKQLYNETLRRPITESKIQIHSVNTSGWMYQNNGRITSFKIVAENDEPLYALSSFSNRDDVYELRKGFNAQRDSGFGFELSFDGIDTVGAKAVFVTERDEEVSILLQDFLRRGSSKLQEYGINFHLDSLDLESSVSSDLVPGHSASVGYLTGIALLAIASLGMGGCRLKRFEKWHSAAILCGLLLFAWIVLRLALCSILDATAYPCEPRYLFTAALPLPWAITCLSALKSN